jgi:hypothetical protein
MQIKQSALDSIAIGASFACLVDCVALPILLAALPAVDKILPVSGSFHLGMLMIAIPASLAALLHEFSLRRAAAPVRFWLLVLG